jgi:hypothetical protein
MSIRAVIAYMQQTDASPSNRPEQLAAVVTQASEAGFGFDASELETVQSVRQLLLVARRDETLRERLLAAEAPSAVLAEIAPKHGLPIDHASLTRVLTAYLELTGELDDRALNHVSGGARAGFIPQTSDEVIVEFVQGDLNAPLVVGALWNPNDRPPTSAGR